MCWGSHFLDEFSILSIVDKDLAIKSTRGIFLTIWRVPYRLDKFCVILWKKWMLLALLVIQHTEVIS